MQMHVHSKSSSSILQPNAPPLKTLMLQFSKNRQKAQSHFRIHFSLKNIYIHKQISITDFLIAVRESITKIGKIYSVQIQNVIDQQHVDVSIGLKYDYQAINFLHQNNSHIKILLKDESGLLKQVNPVIADVFAEYMKYMNKYPRFDTEIDWKVKQLKRLRQKQQLEKNQKQKNKSLNETIVFEKQKGVIKGDEKQGQIIKRQQIERNNKMVIQKQEGEKLQKKLVQQKIDYFGQKYKKQREEELLKKKKIDQIYTKKNNQNKIKKNQEKVIMTAIWRNKNNKKQIQNFSGSKNKNDSSSYSAKNKSNYSSYSNSSDSIKNKKKYSSHSDSSRGDKKNTKYKNYNSNRKEKINSESSQKDSFQSSRSNSSQSSSRSDSYNLSSQDRSRSLNVKSPFVLRWQEKRKKKQLQQINMNNKYKNGSDVNIKKNESQKLYYNKYNKKSRSRSKKRETKQEFTYSEISSVKQSSSSSRSDRKKYQWRKKSFDSQNSIKQDKNKINIKPNYQQTKIWFLGTLVTANIQNIKSDLNQQKIKLIFAQWIFIQNIQVLEITTNKISLKILEEKVIKICGFPVVIIIPNQFNIHKNPKSDYQQIQKCLKNHEVKIQWDQNQWKYDQLKMIQYIRKFGQITLILESVAQSKLQNKIIFYLIYSLATSVISILSSPHQKYIIVSRVNQVIPLRRLYRQQIIVKNEISSSEYILNYHNQMY